MYKSCVAFPANVASLSAKKMAEEYKCFPKQSLTTALSFSTSPSLIAPPQILSPQPPLYVQELNIEIGPPVGP